MPGSIAERLYYLLPIPLQNLGFSLFGLGAWRSRFSRHFYRRLAELQESEHWPQDRIAAFQDEQVRGIVRHAYDTVPFYRRWYHEHGVDPCHIKGRDDLKRLPVLTKELVRENQEEMVSRAYARRVLRVHLTSGTTGTPLRILKTRQAISFQWALWWRHRARFGLTPGQRYLMFGARVPLPANQKRPPFWREDYFGRRTYVSSYHMTPANLPAIVDFLNRQEVEYYLGYPSAINVLAQYLLEQNTRLRRPPRYVITASESLLAVFAERIQRALGAPVTDHYGMAEFAGNMAKCEQGRYHLDFECGCLEGRPLAGSDQGEQSLLLTGWGNPAMPFIRYEVGDYGTPATGACPCGRQSESWARIDGRTEDYIRTPDGRMVVGLNQVMEYAEGAREIQIYQERPTEIEVRVVAGPRYSSASERAMLRELRRRVGNELAIRFVTLASIPRSGSGKFRAVVSKLAGTAEGVDHAAGKRREEN
jgi:phenylacetate-CoA ligase